MNRTVTMIGMSLMGLMLSACAVQEVRALAPLSHVHAQHVDRPAIHGMLVVGDKTVYLSHLPMFHAPHDFQAIFEASFQSPSGEPQRLYAADRAKTGERVYTLVPEPFVLTELLGSRQAFKADLFRGHFERGGTPIAEGITVQVKRVVHFRQFQSGAAQPKQFSGLLFGKGSEVFAAHWISAAPDYDQVLAVTPDPGLSESALAKGLAFAVPNRPNQQALRAGERVAPLVDGKPAPHLAVGQEFYHETGDLAH